MKLFWVFMAVLAVVTATVLLLPKKRAAGPADLSFSASEQASSAQPPIPTAPVADAAVPANSTAGSEAAIPATETTTAPLPTTAEATPAAPPVIASLSDLDKLLNVPASESQPPASRPAMPDAAATLAEKSPVMAPAADAPPPAKLATQLAATTIAKFKEIVPARIRTSEDGWITLDERFNIRGEGTAEKPYELSWDLLVSASETFQPRMGKVRMPERIAMLDGKYVKVTGYVAFPIMSTSQNEMLSMRNMWDGCCIGVPPTPYDAVEVRLAGEVTGRERFTSFGTIEGKLSVDPYIKGNWLLGLYLMEGATLTQIKEGTDPKKHGGM
jgi:hypothetical protein